MLTDDSGFLRCRLGESDSAEPIEFLLTVTSADSYCRRTGLVTRGETQIEDLLLTPMPVLASGHVIDIERKPVNGAQVFAPDEARLSGLRATTNENGEFVLYVPRSTEPSAQLLMARKGERLSDVASPLEGTRDVILTLSSATGGFSGNLLLDPEIPSERVEISRMAEEEDLGLFEYGLSDDQDPGGRTPDPDGAFVLSGLFPGMHQLRFLVDGLELLQVPRVLVAAGEIGTDERCDAVDLRGMIHAFRIDLVAPAGMPLPSGWFEVSCPGQPCSMGSFDGSEVLVLSPYQVPDVKFEVRGFRSLLLEDVREDRTVHLEPGWPIRFVLDDDIPLPKPPISWSVVLFRHGPLFPPIHFEPGQREARGIAVETGEFEVGWLRHEGEADEPPWLLATRGGRYGWPHQMIEIRDVPEEQVLRIGWVPVRP
jgi:hypothetical protein